MGVVGASQLTEVLREFGQLYVAEMMTMPPKEHGLLRSSQVWRMKRVSRSDKFAQSTPWMTVPMEGESGSSHM